MSKKSSNLAALLGDDSKTVESQVTGAKPGEEKGAGKGPAVNLQDETKGKIGDDDTPVRIMAKEAPQIALADELQLPKGFVKVFAKNPDYDKAAKTNTLVYEKILKRYKNIAGKMDCDTIVLLNNVLAEWYNKHLDSVDKVINRKSEIEAL